MERAACNLANGFHSFGYTVEFAAIFDQEVFFRLHPGIRFHKPQGFNVRTLSISRSIRYLRDIVSGSAPDVVIVYNKFYAAITLLALAFIKNKPIVLTSERSSPFYQWSSKTKIFNRLVYSLFPPDGIIAQTKVAAEHQRKYYPAKSQIKVIPNIVRDVSISDQTRQPYILAIGRFNDYLKGFDRLLQAFAKVDKLNWKIAFLGGAKGQDLKIDDLIREYQLEQFIEYHGKVDNIDAWLSKASLFVIPSRSEGFPNALAEAMSAGLPCISFDFVAGPAEIIEHGKNGILVQNGNVDELAARIKQLMNDPVLRKNLGDEARNIRTRLSAKNIIAEHISFIDQLLGKR